MRTIRFKFLRCCVVDWHMIDDLISWSFPCLLGIVAMWHRINLDFVSRFASSFRSGIMLNPTDQLAHVKFKMLKLSKVLRNEQLPDFFKRERNCVTWEIKFSIKSYPYLLTLLYICISIFKFVQWIQFFLATYY